MTDRRTAILTAAIEIADDHGLEAVSMRSVAERVGLSPMALYPHVGSKEALLDGMQGILLGELRSAAAGDGWQARLTGLARAARKLTNRHPWVAMLMFSRPAVAPTAVRVVDVIYQALLEAGVREADVPRLERLFSTFIIGFGASEAGGRFGRGVLDPRSRRGQLPEGDLPGHHRLAPWLDQERDWDAEFEADLLDLRRLIEACVRPGTEDQAPAGSRASSISSTGMSSRTG